MYREFDYALMKAIARLIRFEIQHASDEDKSLYKDEFDETLSKIRNFLKTSTIGNYKNKRFGLVDDRIIYGILYDPDHIVPGEYDLRMRRNINAAIKLIEEADERGIACALFYNKEDRDKFVEAFDNQANHKEYHYPSKYGDAYADVMKAYENSLRSL